MLGLSLSKGKGREMKRNRMKRVLGKEKERKQEKGGEREDWDFRETIQSEADASNCPLIIRTARQGAPLQSSG